jgi:hypothetical protein
MTEVCSFCKTISGHWSWPGSPILSLEKMQRHLTPPDHNPLRLPKLIQTKMALCCLAASGVSDQDVWGVYGCNFSWWFQWHRRRPCLTLTARDITNILLSLAPPHLHGVLVFVTTINLLPVWLSPSIIVHRCRCHRQWIYCRWRCHRLYLFTGVVVIDDEFIAVGVVTGDNCSLLSTTPVINLWLMSTRSVINENLWQGLIRRNKDKFITGVVDTDEQIIAGALFANISPNFRKNSKHLHGILWGPGDTDSWKKPEVKNLLSDSL